MIVVLHPKAHSHTIGDIMFQTTKKELKEMVNSGQFSMDEVKKTYSNSEELSAVKMARHLMSKHVPTRPPVAIVVNCYWTQKYA